MRGFPPIDVSTLTAKGQVTVLKAAREALGLRQGDQLIWELEDGSVRVRAVSPSDLAYLQGLERGLNEWSNQAGRGSVPRSVHTLQPSF
ncbi:AbrB/MazE/SpoVT family DNA-binding domain-containing protein [Synechococcus sp. CBW1006]|uniref:AbrB/MazE/SpoVT family DNA-binding domain-containing protein n=1 Tax=Synechococcus sp. CBW1006 TaxID=1353138 RepID=UPI0018CE8E26|nr:AbrB/MazE/SpoVT family DNA-binding domain-containing protein [Synechococcus sp. CBW1006]QPN65846.1 AbrB/MazE/SpoVT family DNA-binding domain-containing protein [Synechococcus sp. CBW1006]